MNKAVRRTLAYLHVTGAFPSHIRLETWSKAQECIELVPYRAYGVELHKQVVKPEFLAEVTSDPLAVAAAFLKACGFEADSSNAPRRTSHSVAFIGADLALLAYAHREGDGWVWLRRKSVPYQVTLPYQAGEIATYVRSLAADPVPWLTWRAVAHRMAGDHYNEVQAMTWHAAKRSPIDYAAHMVRKGLGDE